MMEYVKYSITVPEANGRGQTRGAPRDCGRGPGPTGPWPAASPGRPWAPRPACRAGERPCRTRATPPAGRAPPVQRRASPPNAVRPRQTRYIPPRLFWHICPTYGHCTTAGAAVKEHTRCGRGRGAARAVDRHNRGARPQTWGARHFFVLVTAARVVSTGSAVSRCAASRQGSAGERVVAHRQRGGDRGLAGQSADWRRRSQ